MLQVSFGQTDITRGADISDPDSLRKGAFYPSPLFVLSLEGLGVLALPGQFQHLELVLRAKGQFPRGSCTLGATGTLTTTTTSRLAELHHNPGGALSG